MRQIVSAACGLWLGIAGAAFAQDTQDTQDTGAPQPAVVVELYTSQGCSACPPADEFMASLVQDPNVIPLALHVDYWDYIGWKDAFADPRFTDRQKAYAHAVGSRMIYTPQMIVNGLDRVEGHEPEQVARLIQAHLAAAAPVALRLERSGDRLRILADPAPLDRPVWVQLVRYRPSETVTIERGENAGRTVTYHNIVTSWQMLGEWPGAAPLAMEADAPGPDPVAVILQKGGPAEIVAAARLD